jgi:hypothetical protein
MKEKEYRGSCLCGYISYAATGEPSFPHLCSCRMCQNGQEHLQWLGWNFRSIISNGMAQEVSHTYTVPLKKQGVAFVQNVEVRFVRWMMDLSIFL